MTPGDNRRRFLTGAIAGAAGVLAGQTMLARREPELPPAREPEPPPSDESRLSFSQQGEDIVLFHLLHELLKIPRPTYLDIGAAHPVRGNNTYLLYTTGSSGVVVEPNPTFAAQLRTRRPLDKVVEAGIGVTDTDAADYYEIKSDPMLNTFSAAQVALLQKGVAENVVARVVKMPLLNINRVIQEQLGKAPDLISTDVEGMDESILRTVNWARFRPAVICAETVPAYATGGASDITKYLRAKDFIVRGGSMFNTIFVDRRRIDA